MYAGNRYHHDKQEPILVDDYYIAFNSFYFLIPINAVKRTTYALAIHDTILAFDFCPIFIRTFSRSYSIASIIRLKSTIYNNSIQPTPKKQNPKGTYTTGSLSSASRI